MINYPYTAACTRSLPYIPLVRLLAQNCISGAANLTNKAVLMTPRTTFGHFRPKLSLSFYSVNRYIITLNY